MIELPTLQILLFGLVVLTGIPTFLCLVFIGFGIFTGKYKNIRTEESHTNSKVTTTPTSLAYQQKHFHRTLFFEIELWNAVLKIARGEFLYLPIVVFSISIYSFFEFLAIYILVSTTPSNLGTILLTGIAIVLPLSLVKHYYKSYMRTVKSQQ
ncbi:hypothetical protein KC717_02270 [Candidatus Dojkabacteria bacterium]|uniref:Uncharacterized protein n=1 Tax=Candidatus Dojkabacteria bacterium TaxID=2099670 RepID=A0A955RKJ9_9BACT|nr:hypothetical protein [Candidatus Dojkabacteria bacterium]